jgi:DNA-binding beta-propeller fold protein YncE
VAATIKVPHALEVAVGAGAVWVTDPKAGTESRIDPATNRVADTIKLGGDLLNVAVSAGAVWVTHLEAGKCPASRRTRGLGVGLIQGVVWVF